MAVRAAILTHMLKPILKLRTWTETVPGVQRLKSLLLHTPILLYNTEHDQMI